MIRIWHIATHTTNIGDGALISGIHQTIREDWNVPVEFIPDCLMEYQNYWGNKRYDQALVDKINTSCNLLLVGGGGMLDGGRGDRNAGMGFDLPYDLLQKIVVPVVFYAVGYNLFDKQIYWNLGKLRRHIKYVTAQSNMMFSVRNDGSLARLQDVLGTDAGGIIEVPDPGMYVPTADTDHPEILQGKDNILVQIAGDNPFSRFSAGLWRYVPVVGKRVLEWRQLQQFKNLGKALECVAKKRDVNYILCPHLVRDYTVTGKFVDNINKGFSRFSFNSTGIQRGACAAQTFFDVYTKVSLVIGMRGHSVICGVGLHTPTIALTSHSKVKGFMSALGLSNRIVDIADPNLANSLDRMVHDILDNRREEVQRLKFIRKECREKTRIFNRKILELVAT